VQDFLQMKQLCALALHKPGNGNACPAGYDTGYLFFGYPVAEQGVPVAILRLFFKRIELLLKLRYFSVTQLGRPAEVGFLLRLLKLGVGPLDFRPEPLNPANIVFFIRPFSFYMVVGLSQIRKLA
jgi:hypothetical protein